MKNAHIPPLVALTCIFVIFVAGLFFTRTKVRTPADIQPLPPAASYGSDAAADTININTTTSAQLQTLPGIGFVLADRIVTYRAENGTFASIGGLMLVPGVGEKKLEAIWDLVTTGG